MSEPSIDNAKLARAEQFLERLKFLFSMKCVAILAADSTASTRERLFAVRVLSNLDVMISKIAWVMVTQGNIVGTYDPGPPEDSTMSDGGLNADIATAWPKILDIE